MKGCIHCFIDVKKTRSSNSLSFDLSPDVSTLLPETTWSTWLTLISMPTWARSFTISTWPVTTSSATCPKETTKRGPNTVLPQKPWWEFCLTNWNLKLRDWSKENPLLWTCMKFLDNVLGARLWLEVQVCKEI